MRPYPILCSDLLDDVADMMDRAASHARERYGGLDADALRWRPETGRWGVGDCLLHLARVNGLYLAPLSEALAKTGAPIDRGRPCRGSWVGRKMTAMMAPEAARRVKTVRMFEPEPDAEVGQSLSTFLSIHGELRAAVDRARGIDVDAVRVPSPASRFLRFRAGDVFRILGVHEQRHLLQADGVMAEPDFPGSE